MLLFGKCGKTDHKSSENIDYGGNKAISRYQVCIFSTAHDGTDNVKKKERSVRRNVEEFMGISMTVSDIFSCWCQ